MHEHALVFDVTRSRTWSNVFDLSFLHQPICLTFLVNTWQVHSPRVLDDHLLVSVQIPCNKSTCGMSRRGVAFGTGVMYDHSESKTGTVIFTKAVSSPSAKDSL